MTYCLGWKYQNSIFLVADTAITHKSELRSSHSSFGELHQTISGEHVEESRLKITPVSPDLIIGFSGNVASAKKIIQLVKTYYQAIPDIPTLLTSVSNSLGPFSVDQAVSLIIGHFSNNHANLYVWGTTKPDQVVEAPDYAYSGSLPPHFAEIAPLLLGKFVSDNLPVQRVLPSILSILQSLGIHNNLLNFNVGGVFVGVQLNDEGFRWQDDITYILTDKEFSNTDYIKCFTRDNALVVRTTIGNITRVFFDSMNNQSRNTWLSKWKDDVNQELLRGNSCYYCILSKEYPNVIIVRSKDCSSETDYLCIDLSNNGKTYNLRFRSDLQEMVRNPVVRDRNDGSLPISFRFLDYRDYY